MSYIYIFLLALYKKFKQNFGSKLPTDEIDKPSRNEIIMNVARWLR